MILSIVSKLCRRGSDALGTGTLFPPFLARVCCLMGDAYDWSQNLNASVQDGLALVLLDGGLLRFLRKTASRIDFCFYSHIFLP